MSNLENYIVKRYGKWVPIEVCSEECGFDVSYAICAMVKGKGTISRDYCYRRADGVKVVAGKHKVHKYEYLVPVMDSLSVRGDTLRYKELAKLIDLNMHLGMNR